MQRSSVERREGRQIIMVNPDERVDEEQIGDLQKLNTTENMKKAIRELFADFDKVRRDLQISEDPLKWSEVDVVRWLHWSVQQFNLDIGVVSCLSGSTGRQLTNDGQQAFLSRSPPFAGDILWEHLEILREEAKQSMIENQPFANDHPLTTNSRTSSSQPMPLSGQLLSSGGQPLTTRGQSSGLPLSVYSNSRLNSLRPTQNLDSTKTKKSKNDENDGGDGHLRLWQFILLLLLDTKRRHIISWTGCKWEFRIFNTNEVARLWGEYKNRPLMTYEKLSRALRYYYDKGFVVKVPGKRFHYAFTWSLEKLLEKIPRHHLQFPYIKG